MKNQTYMEALQAKKISSLESELRERSRKIARLKRGLKEARVEAQSFAEWISENYFVAYTNKKMFYKDGKDHSVKEIYQIFKSQHSSAGDDDISKS